jgi:hypothetical protein
MKVRTRGGTCVNRECLPSKNLIEAARGLSHLAGRRGWRGHPEGRETMRAPGAFGALLFLAVAAGRPCIAASPSPGASAWAALIEVDSYGGLYPDLPVGYANSTRLLNALIRRGWPPDHILLVRDSVDTGQLARALHWLAARVQPGDTALLYVAGEYRFFARDLRWNAVLPGLWRQIPTSRRVLIVETCNAGRLAEAVEGVAGEALPAVGRDEWDWWGLQDTGRLIRGGPFTYFLARALEREPQDRPASFAAAFSAAVADTQTYFRTVIAGTPVALAPFHAMGQYPERLPVFPNPRLVH